MMDLPTPRWRVEAWAEVRPNPMSAAERARREPGWVEVYHCGSTRDEAVARAAQIPKRTRIVYR